MVLKIYNSLSRKVEVFEPREKNKVRVYVCGPTVWDYSHIGHARTYIAFDTFLRYLRYREYETKYVVNITNVDDKIINRAKEVKEDPLRLAERFEKIFFEDMEALGVDKADAHPRVTEHMQDIIKLIQVLIEKGYAYQADGDVYFDVRKVKSYGELSGLSMDDLKMGAGAEVSENKRFPVDFALWKAAEPGELSWESPWGMGRPGWHIECSAMSMKYLGPQLDIHGGGQDLIFPHHENEILQSEAATGKRPFVKYWLHTGFLNVGGKKMSKSLGNIIVIKDLLQKCDPEVFRLFVLSAHYRSPIDFTYESLDQAKRNLERLYNVAETLRRMLNEERSESIDAEEAAFLKTLDDYKQKFIEAMDNDFNVPLALTNLFELARKTNSYISHARAISKTMLERSLNLFMELGGILGILHKVARHEELPEEITRMIEERERARKRGDWKTADSIRAKLRKRGILLEDTPEGVRWKRIGS
jgi:cysteinyl-tRNA synthetase